MTAKTICEILESQVLQFIIVLVLQFSNPDFWRKKNSPVPNDATNWY